MQTTTNRYLIRAQFLGFRFSGWQKQPGQKTVAGMLLKTLKFILPNTELKILGAGRTDAKVSALDYYFELFLKDTLLENRTEFLEKFNKNLPPDIRVLAITSSKSDFNIIQHSKTKEYIYLFSFGTKPHPFSAPFMATILAPLNINLMKEAALLFQGTHDFSSYTVRLRENSKTQRTIAQCYIDTNTLLTANFFPEQSYALHVKGEGFMRYQVRMIMGALLQVGKGELSLEEIKASLTSDSKIKLTFVAPGSGLLLNAIDFKGNT